MNTIIIRLKSLLLFGLLILGLAFVWIGVTTWQSYNAALDVLPEEAETVGCEHAGEEIPAVTIVAQNEANTQDSFFMEYRIERERTRGERVEILREIVANPNSTVQMRQEAQKKLLDIADELERESKTENALVAKGFEDAIVVIQPGSVMVIVPSQELEMEGVARITDIVMKITGCRMEDIIIVPKA